MEELSNSIEVELISPTEVQFKIKTSDGDITEVINLDESIYNKLKEYADEQNCDVEMILHTIIFENFSRFIKGEYEDFKDD